MEAFSGVTNYLSIRQKSLHSVQVLFSTGKLRRCKVYSRYLSIVCAVNGLVILSQYSTNKLDTNSTRSHVDLKLLWVPGFGKAFQDAFNC